MSRLTARERLPRSLSPMSLLLVLDRISFLHVNGACCRDFLPMSSSVTDRRSWVQGPTRAQNRTYVSGCSTIIHGPHHQKKKKKKK
ncbi:hypothetical protein B0J12DRAFT_678077, partial [Macrophomina phaseolina]